MARPCPNPYASTVAGAARLCDAPLGSESPFRLTVMPPLLPGISVLVARIWPSVTGLKLDPPPSAFENLLPGELPLVSVKAVVATSTTHVPLLQYAEKPLLAL